MLLKVHPEDFIVREHTQIKSGSGPFKVYLLRKTNRNTEDVLQELSRMFHVQRKDIGYCGNKDKNAVTEQFITIRNGPSDIRPTETFSATYLCDCAEPLHLGAHEKNFFIITVRAVKHAPVFVPPKNFFGEQRFSENNVAVGLALLQRKYKEAATLLGLSYTTDPINVLRTVPKHTLILYAHAVQSMLWNELAATLPPQQTTLMLPGFGTENTQYESLLAKYGLTEDAFVNRSFPEISLEAVERPVLQDVSDFSASEVHDGVCTVCFSLGKGSYATETVKQLFEEK
jgi:tRNA(Glu) U13 pseudouridine synthase TruD